MTRSKDFGNAGSTSSTPQVSAVQSGSGLLGIKVLSWGLLTSAVAVIVAVAFVGSHSGMSASHLSVSPNGELSDARASVDQSGHDVAKTRGNDSASFGSGEEKAEPASGGSKKANRSQLTEDSNILRPKKIDFVENQQGSQFTLYRFSDNSKLGSTSDRMARPALSLAKLFIAEYVLENGDESDKKLVDAMITESSDAAADKLWAQYPESIDEVAEDYRLFSTRAGTKWGFSVTSTYDVVSFIAQIKDEDPKHPLLEMMKRTVPVAADGYEQDFGTAKLPGVQGTKWGWSDDRSLHSSVSFGKDFVAAAAITGSADDLSEITEKQFIPYLK
ncbi:hypothetical protein QP903_06385 [Corynebacterium pseudodiphtheriticum]|uniref:hypothetical protein n=1 Tax=Corynebacterium pseudodiphtheriticum TaxID=37637 RepID=UPI00254C7E42|nr:hypothetical protein [Corynebacterium pseudodiphtheriticum]MDK8545947.1 hypothetical protein [Corynebacterium pseudodiphtheriticum]